MIGVSNSVKQSVRDVLFSFDTEYMRMWHIVGDPQRHDF